ncbi:hypothetical protein [Fibrella aquatica]|jgi:hypothetical protein|uniref:hypothetical protein n=1 Tax=Fibrella aquatica TaxID=3242487 RepID=UPI00351FD5E0
MRLQAFGYILMMVCQTYAFGQSSPNVRFLDAEGRSAMKRIAVAFWGHPQAPETTCLEAFCSVTFIIPRSSQIDSIQFSAGVPPEISQPMTHALKETAEYWSLDQATPVRIIIPLYIVPSALCEEKDRIGLFFPTVSQVFDYGKPLNTKINRFSYMEQPLTPVQGVVYPPMVIKGRINDVYLVNPSKK